MKYRISNLYIPKFILLLILVLFIQLVPLALCENVVDYEESPGKLPPIDINSLINVTYVTNPKIVAAKYEFESADYAFKEFERDLSQFTPLVINSSLDRQTYSVRGAMDTSTHTYTNTVGVEKDFFNGASMTADVGHTGSFGNEGDANNPLAEFSVSYPLFGSHVTLTRISERSFQENELLSSRLDYVDTVRDTIESAQQDYFWLQVYINYVSLSKKCLKDYHQILDLDRVKSNASEKQQIESEIQSLQSDLVKYEGYINSSLISLRSDIGLKNLKIHQIGNIDLYSKNYYGKQYIESKEDVLIQDAEKNDIKIRVLENARKNSEEKRMLAKKGKWDIFTNLSGTYNFEGNGSSRAQSGYELTAGFNIKLIDPNLLSIEYKKADAEIKKYSAKIAQQELDIRNNIERECIRARSFRGQADEHLNSVESRKNVYEQKLKNFESGKESVDNLVQARKNLYDTEVTAGENLGDFYETISSLDHACNVYFKKLKVNVLETDSKVRK